MASRMQLPKSIVAHHGQLMDEEIMKYAPAVFERTAGPTALTAYQPVATIDLINVLRTAGYGVAMVAQERSIYHHMDAHGKHLVRMRPLDHFKAKEQRSLHDVVPELVIVNAHNTSSSLHMMAGLWRFICLNGLMAGTTLGGYHFRHNRYVSEQAGAGIEKLKTVIPSMMEDVHVMQEHMLTERAQAVFAARALELRWGPATAAVGTQEVLTVRRTSDEGDSLWAVFNRVQEAVMRGGFMARNRAARIKPLENVTSVIDVNRRMWDLAMSTALA